MDLTKRVVNKYQVIDVIGQIDCLADSKNLNSCINSLFENELVKIAINFSKVTYLNTGALSVLTYANNTLAKRNERLVIIGPDDHVRDVLEIAGFDKVFKIYNTEKDFEKATRGA